MLQSLEEANEKEIQDYIYTKKEFKRKITFKNLSKSILVNELSLNNHLFKQITLNQNDVLIGINEKIPILNMQENLELYENFNIILSSRAKFLNEKLKSEALKMNCEDILKLKVQCPHCNLVLNQNFTLHICQKKVCPFVSCFGRRCNQKDCNKTSHENFVHEMDTLNLPEPMWFQIETLKNIISTGTTYNYIFYDVNDVNDSKIISTLGFLDQKQNILIKRCFCQERIKMKLQHSIKNEEKIGCSCFYLIKRNFEIFSKSTDDQFLVCIIVQKCLSEFPTNFQNLANYRKTKLANCQLMFFIDQTQKDSYLIKAPKQLSVFDI